MDSNPRVVWEVAPWGEVVGVQWVGR